MLLSPCNGDFCCTKVFLLKSACCEVPLGFFLLLNYEKWYFNLITCLGTSLPSLDFLNTNLQICDHVFIHREVTSWADTEAQAFQLYCVDLPGDLYIIICFCTSTDVTSFACSWVVQVTDLLLMVKDLQSINQELKKKQLGLSTTDSQGKEALKILNQSKVGFLC